jgi:hypothetical protein
VIRPEFGEERRITLAHLTLLHSVSLTAFQTGFMGKRNMLQNIILPIVDKIFR